jgi:hypothetical protein
LAPKITKPNVNREKLFNLPSYKKCARKMLMKLTQGLRKKYQGVQVIQILCSFEQHLLQKTSLGVRRFLFSCFGVRDTVSAKGWEPLS